MNMINDSAVVPAAKIFLAGGRGHSEDACSRSLHTFQCAGYENIHKQAFRKLVAHDDITLAAGAFKSIRTDHATMVYILPIVGAVDIIVNGLMLTTVSAGELASLSLEKEQELLLQNCFNDELINILYTAVDINVSAKSINKNAFDLPKSLNRLLQVNNDKHQVKLYLGQFDGRRECLLKPDERCDYFVFVVEGAFEVNGRLLEARDGLALSAAAELDMEALSNAAIILVIEMDYSK